MEKKSTIMNSYDEGGLNFLEFSSLSNYLKFKCLRQLFRNRASVWKHFCDFVHVRIFQNFNLFRTNGLFGFSFFYFLEKNHQIHVINFFMISALNEQPGLHIYIRVRRFPSKAIYSETVNDGGWFLLTSCHC